MANLLNSRPRPGNEVDAGESTFLSPYAGCSASLIVPGSHRIGQGIVRVRTIGMAFRRLENRDGRASVSHNNL